MQWHHDLAAKWRETDPHAAGGVDFRYTVQGAVLAGGTPFNLAWASGTTIDTEFASSPPIALGDDLTPLTVANTDGEYTLHVPASELGIPPDGTQDLLAVADPTSASLPLGLIHESDEENNVQPLNATSHDVLDNSITVTTGADDTITAVFMPAGGLLNMAQAAAICGVDHFNWAQTYVLPSDFIPYQGDDPSGILLNL